MATKVESHGKCELCGKKFSKGSMANHLRSCRRKAAAGANGKLVRTFHLVVEGSRVHWLHLHAAADTTLADLDALLRKTWLECCGHLSDFEIEGARYSNTPDMGFGDFTDESMDVALGEVLREGLRFKHTYDYGTTSECRLRVISDSEVPAKRGSIEFLARNDPPKYECTDCGKPAVHICTECSWQGAGFLCDDCLAEHGCEEEFALPLVNSPRAGMCAYTGESDDMS